MHPRLVSRLCRCMFITSFDFLHHYTRKFYPFRLNLSKINPKTNSWVFLEVEKNIFFCAIFFSLSHSISEMVSSHFSFLQWHFFFSHQLAQSCNIFIKIIVIEHSITLRLGFFFYFFRNSRTNLNFYRFLTLI